MFVEGADPRRVDLLARLALFELAEAEDGATFMPMPSDPRARRVAEQVLAEPAGVRDLDGLAQRQPARASGPSHGCFPTPRRTYDVQGMATAGTDSGLRRDAGRRSAWRCRRWPPGSVSPAPCRVRPRVSPGAGDRSGRVRQPSDARGLGFSSCPFSLIILQSLIHPCLRYVTPLLNPSTISHHIYLTLPARRRDPGSAALLAARWVKSTRARAPTRRPATGLLRMLLEHPGFYGVVAEAVEGMASGATLDRRGDRAGSSRRSK